MPTRRAVNKIKKFVKILKLERAEAHSTIVLGLFRLNSAVEYASAYKMSFWGYALYLET